MTSEFYAHYLRQSNRKRMLLWTTNPNKYRIAYHLALKHEKQGDKVCLYTYICIYVHVSMYVFAYIVYMCVSVCERCVSVCAKSLLLSTTTQIRTELCIIWH